MYKVDENIASAETLPSSFYRDKAEFVNITDALLSKSFQWLGDRNLLNKEINVLPIEFYPNIIGEPLLLLKSGKEFSVLSNVCTHRGNLLVTTPGKYNKLICGYHGRKFDLTGNFESMPEFEKTVNFPRACDNLTRLDLVTWRQFLFVNLTPTFSFQGVIRALEERVGFLPVETFKIDPARSKNYRVNAHWALYCDNYLEGFHIPFVHPDLNQSVEFSTYETIIFDYCNVQIGYSKDKTESFNLPAGHPDYGKNVAAYYYWIFPNLMMNFYPWGLSVNVVEPIDSEHTIVKFISYIYDETKVDNSAGALLDKVEMEDEEIVQNVQKGIKSRFYSTGRFSPTKEKGVHHFHQLISQLLAK